ncbi:MAG: alpha/beta fold hydrolase, partial [Lachnospiraceae bacterium]|nr:alpha/beta fold hydrolase [Lachnospiraceae bacterium]
NIINIIPAVGKYNPVSLSGTSISLLNDTITPRTMYPALVVSVIGTVAFTMLAVLVFNKRKAAKKAAFLAAATAVCMVLTVFIGEDIPRQISLDRHVISEKIIIGEGTEWELHGILTIPKNADGKVPAVVLVHGSGAHDMDETIFDNKPFRDIAEYLSENGIAVIRYNKRSLTHGLIMSELNGLTVWEETIEDAILATAILKSDPRIDEDRVYILGHSLGGMLAPRIHVMGGDYAGIIVLGGSPRFLLDISTEQVMVLAAVTDDEDEKADILASHKNLTDEFELIIIISDEEVKNTIFPHWGNMGYYWKDLYENPVSLYLEQTTVPMFVMQADDDVQVLTDIDFAMYQELLSAKDNVTFKLYPGLNHLFMPSAGRDISEIMDEYRIKSHVAPQVLSDINVWINDN